MSDTHPTVKPPKAIVKAPDYALKEKIGKDANLRDLLTGERIAASQKEIDKVQQSFLENAQEKLSQMRLCFSRSQDSKLTKEQLISGAFLLKGQAESLGYVLFARTAQLLCEYCEQYLATDVEHRAVIIGKHFDTMQVVIKDKIKGDGGKVGRDLAQGLKMLVKKYHP